MGNEAKKQRSRKRSEAWAKEELTGIKPADPRQVRRLHQVLAMQHSSPGASIPQAGERWAEVKGAYRLADSEAFTDRDLLASHRAATVRRIQQAQIPAVLVAQDTTSLNYSNRPNTSGLGPIGNNADKTMGLFSHNQLCLDARNGAALGLLGAKLWARDPAQFKSGPAGARNRQPIEEKESYRWLEGYQATQQLAQELGPTVKVISVADREGDIYEVFAECQRHQASGGAAAQLLIRAQHNRALSAGEARSHDAVRTQPMQASVTVAVSRQAGRKSRPAHLEVRFANVELLPPGNQQKYQKAHARLTLSLIIASEPKPPAGEEPVEWILWSSQLVQTKEDALQQLGYYGLRWQIEVLHRIVKSGCKVEQRQLETGARLKLFIAIDLMIAVYLLGLTHAARVNPQAPASDWLADSEQQALQAFVQQTRADPSKPMNLQTVVNWIGQLGGHLGRKSDGPPGPLALWRGLLRLQDITAAWLIFSGLSRPNTCG